MSDRSQKRLFMIHRHNLIRKNDFEGNLRTYFWRLNESENGLQEGCLMKFSLKLHYVASRNLFLSLPFFYQPFEVLKINLSKHGSQFKGSLKWKSTWSRTKEKKKLMNKELTSFSLLLCRRSKHLCRLYCCFYVPLIIADTEVLDEKKWREVISRQIFAH